MVGDQPMAAVAGRTGLGAGCRGGGATVAVKADDGRDFSGAAYLLHEVDSSAMSQRTIMNQTA